MGCPQVPIGSEDKLTGLVDLVDRQAYHFLGASGEEVTVSHSAARGRERESFASCTRALSHTGYSRLLLFSRLFGFLVRLRATPAQENERFEHKPS